MRLVGVREDEDDDFDMLVIVICFDLEVVGSGGLFWAYEKRRMKLAGTEYRAMGMYCDTETRESAGSVVCVDGFVVDRIELCCVVL
jgi:hypothetical protein